LLILKEENRRLFGEQVNDHIEKLNDLMGLGSGAVFNENGIRRACLATRLLEGSTRMLGFDGWSRTLRMFRDLLEKSVSSGRRWDEQLAQIVSEVLETEEQMAAEILAGELEEISRDSSFEGLQREIDVISREAPAGEAPAVTVSTAPTAPAVEREEEPEIVERLSTLTRLVDSLVRVREIFHEFLDKPTRAERVVRELEIAFGESEFFMGIIQDMLRRLGKNTKPFVAKISCGTVLDGVKDFFSTCAKMRRWNATLATRCTDFTLDRENASALAVVLDGCLFDMCRRYEMRDEISLTIGVDVRSDGSHLVAKIQDNGPDFLCDTEIDREDISAFYPGLREARARLASFGALLWVEPAGGSDGRFRFTLPRTKQATDYYLFTASGARLAVPCHSMDCLLAREAAQRLGASSRLFAVVSGAKVPVFALDELICDDDVDSGKRHDHIIVAGLGEHRIGLLIEGVGRRVEGVAEQLTEGSWAGLTNSILNVGEEEFPVIDMRNVLQVASSLQGAEGAPEEAGSYVDGGSGCHGEVTVPRA
jgi:hypothetical protein